jgi:hypothetical protein
VKWLQLKIERNSWNKTMRLLNPELREIATASISPLNISNPVPQPDDNDPYNWPYVKASPSAIPIPLVPLD